MESEITEERIKERAHQIWEREGCRDGDNESHWRRAYAELQQEGHATADEAVGNDKAGNMRAGVSAPSSGAASGVDSMEREKTAKEWKACSRYP